MLKKGSLFKTFKNGQIFIVQLTIGITRYLENDLCRVLQVAGLNLNSHNWARSKGIINAKKGSLFKTCKN